MKWLPFQKLPFAQQAASASPASMAQLLSKGMPETRRLMQQHQQMKRVMHGNFMSPVLEPRMILDIGCINGRWAMELAMQYPGARVVGIDSVLPAPFLCLGNGIDQKPSNVELMQGDIACKLPFPDGTFDLVHACFIYSILPAQAWEPLLREAIRVTRPGGWIEMLEPLPYAVQQREGLATIIRWFSDWLRQNGCDPLVALKIVTLMKAAGLDRVSTCQLGQPTADPNDADEMALQRQNSQMLIDLLREPLVSAGIVAKAEYERVAAIAQTEAQRQSGLNGFNTYVNFAQRPG